DLRGGAADGGDQSLIASLKLLAPVGLSTSALAPGKRSASTHTSDAFSHGLGLACDLVKDVSGEPSWKGDFGFLKELAEDNGLIWGGDWGNDTIVHSFVDSDHVQRINVADQAKLFDVSWYPDADYEPVIV